MIQIKQHSNGTCYHLLCLLLPNGCIQKETFGLCVHRDSRNIDLCLRNSFYIFDAMKEYGIITIAMFKVLRRNKSDEVGMRYLRIYYNIKMSKESWQKRKYRLWKKRN